MKTKILAFFDTITNMENKVTLYHGSGIEITDGFIRVKPAYLTKNNQQFKDNCWNKSRR